MEHSGAPFPEKTRLRCCKTEYVAKHSYVCDLLDQLDRPRAGHELYHKEVERIRIFGSDVAIAHRCNTEVEIRQGEEALQCKIHPLQSYVFKLTK